MPWKKNRQALAAVMFLLLPFGPAALAQSAQNIDNELPSEFHGSWEGELRLNDRPVYVHVRLEMAAGRAGLVTILGQQIHLIHPRPEGDAIRLTLEGDWQNPPEMVAARLDNILVGRWIEPGRELPFELERLPDLLPASTRLEAWRQDIETLETRFLRFDRSFSGEEEDAFLGRMNTLRENLDELSDEAIIMEMARAISLSGNAHTRLYLLRNRTNLRRVPIRLFWFGDDLRVVATADRYQSLVGCRIDAIENVDIDIARNQVGEAFAGNESWQLYKSPYFLTSPDALFGLGVSSEQNTITYQVSACDYAGVLEIGAEPLVRSDEVVESWHDLSAGSVSDGWTHVRGSNVADPAYLSAANQHYDFTMLEDGILYVRYSRSAPDRVYGFADFSSALLETVRNGGFRAFVLDLRFNTGGNGQLAENLMAALDEETREMPRYLVIGRATFSAGIQHAAIWRERGDITTVGEPVGDELDWWSEGGNIILPNSQLEAHFANGAHSYSPAPCPSPAPCIDRSSPPLGPDIETSLSWQEYLAGNDPALDAIRRDLTAR